MIFSKEFKVAILSISPKEKEQLLFRLLKKDVKLVKRLEFELLSEESVDTVRDRVAEDIVQNISAFQGRILGMYYEIRRNSSLITEHVFTCRDKLGEVFLNLILLRAATQIQEDILWKSNGQIKHIQKVHHYFFAKLFRCFVLTLKLEPDLLLELQDEYRLLGEALFIIPAAKTYCDKLGIEEKWLKDMDIPENIELQYKNLRVKKLL